MKSLIFVTLTVAFLSACGTSKKTPKADSPIISVMHGTNFGHCRGYCRKEVIFMENEFQYIESSVDEKNQPKQQNFKANSDNWKNILSQIDWNKFNSLEESYGCPDCADGGSEYIEIKSINGTKRVTIEFNKESAELEPLLTELRKQRKILLEK